MRHPISESDRRKVETALRKIGEVIKAEYPETPRTIVFSDDELEDTIRSLTATLNFMVDYPEENDGYTDIQRLRERMRQQRAAFHWGVGDGFAMALRGVVDAALPGWQDR